jgi:O-antigen/teichoic acid export membrane protein
MKSILKSLRNGLATPTARQTYLLYASQLSFFALGAVAQLILTANMSKESFGDQALVKNIVTFLSVFFEFGILTAGSRLLALRRGKENERGLVSALLMFGILLTVAFVVVIGLAGFVTDSLFNTGESVRLVLWVFAVPLSLLTFKFLFQLIYQGTNEILKMSFYNFAVQAGYVALLAASLAVTPLTLWNTLAAYSLALTSITIFLIWKGKPSWKNLLLHKAEILAETKAFGIVLYFGRVVSVLTYSLDSIMLAAYHSSTNVGRYNIMTFFVTPIAAFSDAFQVAIFKKLSDEKTIPAKVFLINSLWLVGIGLVYVIIGKIIFLFFFPKYAESLSLLYPLVATMIFQGLTKPYNYFLSVKGEGRYLRGTAITVAVANVVFNVLLIPPFAEIGAAYASLASVTVNYAAHLFFYAKYKKAPERIAR